MLVLALLACHPDDPPTTTDPGTEPEPLQIDAMPPVLPTQLLIDLDDDLEALRDVVVTHEGPDGVSDVLEAVYTADGDRMGWEAPGGRWAAGTHTVRLDPTVARWGTPEGLVDAFDFEITDDWGGDGRAHEAWTIDTLVMPPSGAGALVLELVGDLVVVPPVDDEGDWVLLTTLSDCVVYRGPVVTLPEGYELALDTVEIDVGAEGPLRLEETRLAFSFRDAGSAGFGSFRTLADGRGTVDLDADGGIGPSYVCTQLPSFGAGSCHLCEEGDAEPLCLDAWAPLVGMSPRVEPLLSDPMALPICGVDVSGAEPPDVELHVPPISCDVPQLEIDVGCGCRSVPGRLGLAFVPVVLLWWRRRR